MNQILVTNLNGKHNTIFPSLKKIKFIFWCSIFVIFLCLIFYSFTQYNAWQKEKVSKILVNQFSIRDLYANSNGYVAERLATTISNENPFVIGLLQIKKIDLMYPILSTSSEELLKISPCRFYGPMPNEVGNLCIAGHNYANQKHFGKLTSLKKGDTFQIYDLNGGYVDYMIHEQLEVNTNDTSCMEQNTNGERHVTLVTCNTLRGTRIVIKAKENR